MVIHLDVAVFQLLSAHSVSTHSLELMLFSVALKFLDIQIGFYRRSHEVVPIYAGGKD